MKVPNENPNIAIHYRFRGGDNSKRYHTVVFQNTQGINLEQVRQMIDEKLTDGIFFYPQRWGLPTLYFENHDPLLDPDWHEFVDLMYVNETGFPENTIEDLLSRIRSSPLL